MAGFDDVTVTWLPPRVLADWDNNGTSDAIDDLSGVVGQINVTYDLDDGLPSDITFADSQGPAQVEVQLAAPDGGPAARYYSPYRTDSPLYGKVRDVAPVTIDVGAVTDAGPQYERIFTGQMVGLPVKRGEASVQMMSATRLKLAQPVMIRPFSRTLGYEPAQQNAVGLDATWLVSFIAASCGVYASPPLRSGGVMWIPMHGSLTWFYPDALLAVDRTSQLDIPYNAETYDTDAPFNDGADPVFVDGPYLKGFGGSVGTHLRGFTMDITGGTADHIAGDPGNPLYWYDTPFPVSQAENRGRLEMWVRGDTTDLASVPGGSAAYDSQFDSAFLRFRCVSVQAFGASTKARIRTSDRRLVVDLTDNTNTLTVASTNPLPADGDWHFVGFAWSWIDKQAWVNLDGSVTTSANASLSTSALALTASDEQLVQLDSFLSVAEIQGYVGENAHPTSAAWGNEIAFEPTAIIHSDLQLEAVIPTEPREGYEWIAALAQTEQAAIRIDEQDRLLYLNRGYWTTSAQQVVSEVIDTDRDIADLDIATDHTKIRNVVTVSFQAATTPRLPPGGTTVYEAQDILPIVPGTSRLRVAFSMPVRVLDATRVDRIFGGIDTVTPDTTPDPFGTAISPTSYIIASQFPDGAGPYATLVEVSARVVVWDAGGAVLEFGNTTGTTYYLAGDNEMPYIRLTGSPVVLNDTTIGVSHEDSVTARGVRYLPVDLPEMQLETEAARYAHAILGDVAYPVDVLENVEAFGDPRRKPGDLVAVADEKMTGVTGSFRALRVGHRINGAEYQQTLRLRAAMPVGTWDETTWDHCVWGEEAL